MMAYRQPLIAALLASVSFVALNTAASADGGKVEKVVVTAQKRSQALRDVPMGVTAITGKDLERQRATQFADFVDLVPGMSYTAGDPGHTSLTLRGVNTQGVAATIATYLDETPYGSSSALANGTNKAANIDTFDIQRIEVLRGPQGTLYGANTLGGLLKFVTNKPDPTEFDNKFEFGGDTVSDGGTGGFVKGMMNVPLGSEAAVRAVGYYRDYPGFIDDPNQGKSDINDVEMLGGRAMLLFQPSENFSVNFMALAHDIDAGSGPIMDVNIGPGNSLIPAFGDLTQKRVSTEFSDVGYRVYNGTVNWDMGWAQLVSATSWATYDETSRQDGTAVFLANIDSSLFIDKFTQEVRLVSSSTDSPLEWLVGAFFTHERAGLHQDIIGGPLNGGFVDLQSKFIELAGFANLTYHFSKSFDLSLGGRYSSNDQSSLQTGLTGLASGSSSENVFTYTIAPSWKVTEDTLLYARVGKGYRPGGPNALPPPPIPPGVPTSFESDTATSYELGFKTDLADGKLFIDAAAFFIEWDNVQLLFFIPGFGGVNGNGGTAESKGVELGFSWTPTDALTLRGNVAYIDAYLTADTDPIIIGAVSGDPLPFIADWSGSLSADYQLPSMGGFDPFIGATWRYVGERTTDFDPAVRIPLDAYDTFDLRAGVEHKQWTVQLYAKNITDERGIVGFGSGNFSAASGTATVSVTTPRTIGIAVTGKF